MSSFAERLKDLRKSKNLTQVNMAAFLGCTEQHYQRLEYGKVTPNAIMLIKLADFFKEQIAYGGGSKNKYNLKILYFCCLLDSWLCWSLQLDYHAYFH